MNRAALLAALLYCTTAHANYYPPPSSGGGGGGGTVTGLPTSGGTMTGPINGTSIATSGFWTGSSNDYTAGTIACSGATQLTTQTSFITAALANQSVAVASAPVGTVMFVQNQTGVYVSMCPPSSGATLNGLAAGAPVSLPPGGGTDVACQSSTSCRAY